jgi:hypothetical protein
MGMDYPPRRVYSGPDDQSNRNLVITIRVPDTPTHMAKILGQEQPASQVE